MRLLAVCLTVIFAAAGLTGCATDDTTSKKHLSNPGDELSGRPQGGPWKDTHVASPMGGMLPTSR